MTLFDRVVALLRDHGIARSTFDIDVLTMDGRVLEPALWDSLRAHHTTIEIRPGDVDDPLAGVVRIDAAGELLVGEVSADLQTLPLEMRERWAAARTGGAESTPKPLPPAVLAGKLVGM